MERSPGRWETPFLAALWIYATVMDAGPHVVVGQRGEVARLAPDDVCAWHVGGKGSRPYSRRSWALYAAARYGWWIARWPGLLTPHALGSGRLWAPYEAPPALSRAGLVSRWARGSCNANTLGVEVVPPLDGGPWYDAAWEALVGVLRDWRDAHGLVLARETVVSHSDAHPLARTRRSGQPWDPPPGQWSWDECARRLA